MEALFLCCDQGGRIIKLYDPLKQTGRFNGRKPAPGQRLPELFDVTQQERIDTFLDVVRHDGVAFDRKVLLAEEGPSVAVYCTGVRLGDRLIVGAAPDRLQLARQFCNILQKEEGPYIKLLQTVAQDRLRRVREDLDEEYTNLAELSRLVSEMAAAQRELAKTKVALERAIQQKNHLLGVAAHEMRNPLTSIRFYSNYLLTHSKALETDKGQRFLRVIAELSEFTSELLDDLLTVSNLESGKLTLHLDRHDLVRLIAQNIETHQMMAENKGIALIYDPEEADLPATVDKAKIKQVLNNLLSNAIKFSSPGDTVRVRLGQEDGFAVISVEDEGPGIPEEERERLFEPFGKTSVKSTAGERSTGLGLSISRNIVEGHRGRIWVESEVGKGSSFVVELPCS